MDSNTKRIKDLLAHCTEENALSYNDIRKMSDDELKQVITICWHEACYNGGCNYESFRCDDDGIRDICYVSTKYSQYELSWSDDSGDPSVYIDSFDEKIHQLGDGEWDYGLYKPKK